MVQLSHSYMTTGKTIALTRWMKHKLESRLPGEISIISDMRMTPSLLAESKEELKSLLMKALVLGSEITTDSDCSHEIKRRFLLGRKAMTNLDSILKGRDITLSTKVHIVKAMAFPVVMYGCES